MSGEADAKSRPGAALVRQLVAQATRAVCRAPRATLDLAFPPACVGCGGELTHELAGGEAPFCPACRQVFGLSVGWACPRCAAPLPGTQEKPSPGEIPGIEPIAWVRPQPRDCVRCRGRRFWFHAAIAAGRYSGRMRDLVLKMKRADQNWISLAMGQLVWDCCGAQLVEGGADLVVPVPLHWRRRLAHGTNSAALLAEVLARRLGAPMAPRLLRRHRNTQPQFSLTPAERRANVQGAFTVRAGYPIEKARVLLVDDIMTSGATCNEAARSLRKAGAQRVTVVVVARAVPSL